CGGGSGLGDPLSRNPTRVAEDVKSGYVSLDQAAKAYGVIVDPATGSGGSRATGRWRGAIRGERLGAEPHRVKEGRAEPEALRPLSPDLEEFVHQGQAMIRCIHCNTTICSSAEDWRAAVPLRESDLAQYLSSLQIWIQRREAE